MAFVAAPNIIEVQLRYTLLGQQAMNRFHVHVGTGPTEAQCALTALTVAGWWVDNVKALVPPGMELREVFCKGLALENDVQATFSAGLPSAGTHNINAMPNNCSLCVSLRSGLTGRSARGRWFWAGLTEDQVEDNTVVTGSVTDIVAAIDALRDAIEALGLLWMIVSYVNNGAPRAGGPVYFQVVDALVVDDVVDSQRRRLPGRGS
jgi:hypothetical protein